MNSHKKVEDKNLDITLRRSLKNWVASKQPPPDGKERLLRAAEQESKPKASFISAMVYIALSDQLGELYLERFRVSPFYSLQPGSISLSSMKSVV